jgi:hypothetical protein
MGAKQDFCSNICGPKQACVQIFGVQKTHFVEETLGRKQNFCSKIWGAKKEKLLLKHFGCKARPLFKHF